MRIKLCSLCTCSFRTSVPNAIHHKLTDRKQRHSTDVRGRYALARGALQRAQRRAVKRGPEVKSENITQKCL